MALIDRDWTAWFRPRPAFNRATKLAFDGDASEVSAMGYGEQFQAWREAKGYTREDVARRARCHRNTVNNVEKSRATKFATIVQLMRAMGYGPESTETKALAVAWLESVSGIRLSVRDAQELDREIVRRNRSSPLLKPLVDELLTSRLRGSDVELLLFAARHPPMLAALRSIRTLVRSTP